MSTAFKPSSAVIVGLGRTGLSCARYLHALGWKIAVTDTRAQPPELAAVRQLDARIPVSTGGLDVKLLDDALCVVASPGVSLNVPFLPSTAGESWSVVPLAGEFLLISRQNQQLPRGVIEKINQLLRSACPHNETDAVPNKN